MYDKFIMQLGIYAKGHKNSSKRVFTNFALTSLWLQEILDEIKIAIQKTNLGYDIVIKRLYIYYDLKLVTCGTDKDKNLIVQFPIFIQPYTQQPLILYQL